MRSSICSRVALVVDLFDIIKIKKASLELSNISTTRGLMLPALPLGHSKETILFSLPFDISSRPYTENASGYVNMFDRGKGITFFL